MLNPEETHKLEDDKFQNEQTFDTYKQAVINLQSTLIKSFQNRHHHDHQAILHFIQLSPFFKEFHLHFSHEFAKNIVKRGKVYCINGNRRIYGEGEQMVRVLMPLAGKFFKRYEQNKPDETQTVYQRLQQLIQSVQMALPLRKKSTSMQRKMSLIMQNTDMRTTHGILKEIDKLNPFSNEQPLFFDGIAEESYKQSIYSSGEAWVFTITVESLRKCFFQEYEYRLIQKGGFFRKMSCFNILDNGQLKSFVERIPFVQMKKDQYVFRQGDSSEHLYLLIEGEVKAQRTVELFKEDPNSLYRAVSKSQAGRRSQKPPQFSYADFQGVYNYSPQKKRMDLGILTPVTIFGEQEVVAGLPRQADVQIASTKAKMFVFTLKDIEAAGNGKKVSVQAFMDELYDSITLKRINVRREGLSNKLQLENRRKMNYFFIDPSSSQQKTSRTRSRTAKQRINRELSPAVTIRPHSPVKPRYHNFNFNQFIIPKKESMPRFSQDEIKIANLAHNSGEIQDQIQASSRLSQQRQSYKHKINIATPLFDTNYYRKQRKEILRIENKKRMRQIAVTGVSVKSKSRLLSSSMA